VNGWSESLADRERTGDSPGPNADLVNRQRKAVMAGLDPAIHGRGEAEMAPGKAAMMWSFVSAGQVGPIFEAFGAWMAGSSPAMTAGPKDGRKRQSATPFDPQFIARN
jgi:hypothetical protein